MTSFAGILASDGERTDIVARLQNAAAEGRLTLGELSYRASRAYAARTWAELDRLVSDLPVLPVDQPAVPRPCARSRGLAVAALIVGVLSVPATLMGPLGAVLGPVGVLLGVAALCSEDGRQRQNRRYAVAGIAWSMAMLTAYVTVPLLLGASLS